MILHEYYCFLWNKEWNRKNPNEAVEIEFWIRTTDRCDIASAIVDYYNMKVRRFIKKNRWSCWELQFIIAKSSSIWIHWVRRQLHLEQNLVFLNMRTDREVMRAYFQNKGSSEVQKYKRNLEEHGEILWSLTRWCVPNPELLLNWNSMPTGINGLQQEVYHAIYSANLPAIKNHCLCAGWSWRCRLWQHYFLPWSLPNYWNRKQRSLNAAHKDKIKDIKATWAERRSVYLVLRHQRLFILLNAYMVIITVLYPSASACLVILYIFFYRVDYVLLLITFCTPLAVNITQFEFNVGISLPTEPWCSGCSCFSSWSCAMRIILIRGYGSIHDNDHWIQFLWILITSITSQIPLFPSSLCLPGCGLSFLLHLCIHLFKKRNISGCLSGFMHHLVIVIIIQLTSIPSGFWWRCRHWVMSRFIMTIRLWRNTCVVCSHISWFTFTRSYSRLIRLLAILSLHFCFWAYLSYCRAAWISLIVVSIIISLFSLELIQVYILQCLYFRIDFYTFQFEILDALSKNKQGTSGILWNMCSQYPI